jgi:tetratricopeptide (TPR) repeat protein
MSGKNHPHAVEAHLLPSLVLQHCKASLHGAALNPTLIKKSVLLTFQAQAGHKNRSFSISEHRSARLRPKRLSRLDKREPAADNQDVEEVGLLTSLKSRHMWIAAALVGVAAVLRFAYLRDLAAIPFFDHPIMDASYHDAWARRIAGGELLGDQPFFRDPLYAYLLGALYRLSDGSYLLPRVIQFSLGSLTCLFAYLVAKRAKGLLAGVIAGALCAAYPVLIYFEGELLTESLFTFLGMLGIWLLDRARYRGGRRDWFLGGLVLGLALITRPTIMLLLPAAVAGAMVFARRRWLAAGLLVLGIAIPVAPVTTHNYVVSGEFIPLVWQGGLNLYLGNNPAADGWSATSPELRKDWWGGYKDQIAIPREELGREPSYREVSAYWEGRAARFMREEPGRFARLLLKKTALYWGSREFPNNQDYNFFRLHAWVLRNPVVSFGVVAPLALLGIFALLPAWRKLYFAYALLASYFLVTVAFFVCDRYRAPVLPILCIFAGGSIAYLVDSMRQRKRMRLALSVLGLAGAALVVNLNLAGIPLPSLAQSYTQLGKVYLESDREEDAAVQFREALKIDPRWAEAYEQLGLIEMKHGRSQEAAAFLEKAVEIAPQQATAYRALAMLDLSEGDLEAARQAIRKALEAAPYLEDSHNVLGSIERQAGNFEAALRAFRQELEINPGNWRTQANLGSLYEAMGDLGQAETSYRKALEIKGEDPDLALALAGVYSRQGKDEDALRLLERVGPGSAKEIDLRYNQAAMLQSQGKIDEARVIYESVLALMPDHERSLVNLGVIYARQGEDQKAIELWQRALKVNPSNATARRNIELLRERLGQP